LTKKSSPFYNSWPPAGVIIIIINWQEAGQLVIYKCG